MGIYNYKLLTAGKNVLIDGERIPVYPYVFDGKESFAARWDKRPNTDAARMAALEAAWLRRSPAKYVVFGGDPDGLVEGAMVYRRGDFNLPFDDEPEDDKGEFPIHCSEHYQEKLVFVGILVLKGKRLALQRWKSVTVPGPGHEARQRLDGLVKDEIHISTFREGDPWGGADKLVSRVAFKNDNDAVIGKVALA